jgi:hypothetical protein
VREALLTVAYQDLPNCDQGTICSRTVEAGSIFT